MSAFTLSSTLSLPEKEIEAIDFIQANEPPEGYFVGFSGGKDSLVTLDMVRRSGVAYHAYYSATLIDPPEVVKFIRLVYPAVTHLRPTMTFWQGILKNNLPLRKRRWCCDVLKKNPSKNIPLSTRIMGLRAEESPRRASRPRVDFYKKQTLIKPIFFWNEGDVWDYIEKYSLTYPAMYDEGFHRIGCVICPFNSGGNLNLHRQRWPGFYRILHRYMDILWEKNLATWLNMNFTYEIYMRWPEWPSALEREYLKQQGNLFEEDGNG